MTSTISVYQASLASFGTPVLAGTKMVKPGSVTLQGNNGAWVTIASDQYLIGLQTGLIRQSTLDDDGAAVDWSTYTSFRATYTVLSSGTETTYTNELVTGSTANDGLFVLTEAAAVPVGADGELIADFLRWVAVNGPVYATQGYIAGVIKVIGSIIAGGGAVTIDSTGVSITIGTGIANSITWYSGATPCGTIYTDGVAATGRLNLSAGSTGGTIGSTYLSLDNNTQQADLMGGIIVAATGLATTLKGNLTLDDGKNIVLNTTNGTKIATASGQKLGFWNATPVIRPSSAGDTSIGAAGGANAVYRDTTFTGGTGSTAYTIGDIVRALKLTGLITS